MINLRGGGLGKQITRGLAFQAALSTVSSRPINNNRQPKTLEVNAVTSLSSTAPIMLENLGINTDMEVIQNKYLGEYAHNLSYSAQKPIQEKVSEETLSRDIIINRQISSIKKLLLKEGYLNSYKEHDIAPEIIIKQVIHFIKFGNHRHRKTLARRLLKAEGVYLEKNKNISEDTINFTINNWISQVIFGKSAKEFILQAAVDYEDTCSVTSLKNIATHFIRKKLSMNHEVSKITSSDAEVELYLIKKVLASVMPIISEGIYDHVIIGSPESLYINAGMLFEIDLKKDPYLPEKDELSALGQAIYLGLQKKLVDKSFVKYFELLAIIQYAKYIKIKSGALLEIIRNKNDSIKEKAIDNCFDKLNKYNIDNNPLYIIERFLKDYKTRQQLAEDNLKEHQCPALSVDDYLNDQNVCCKKFTSYYSPRNYLNPFQAPVNWKVYDSECKTLTPAKELFEKQLDKIAKAFKEMDILFVNDAFDNLSNEDKNFISTSSVSQVNFHVSGEEWVTYISSGINYGRGRHPFSNHTSSLDKIKIIFSAENTKGEIKYYAVEKNDTGYEIIKINKDTEYIYSLFDNHVKSNFAEGSLEVTDNEPIKNVEQDTKELVSYIIELNWDKLKKELYEKGIGESSHEKLKRIAYSFILFKECADRLVDSRLRVSLPICLLDLASIIPAVRGGYNLLRAVTKISTMSKSKAFLDLSKGIASSLDPGFELGTAIGKQAVKKIVKLGKSRVDSLPKLQGVLSPAEEIANRVPIRVAPDRFALLHDSEVLVPLKKLNEKHNGRDVYVRFNEKIGEISGIKYTCKKNIGRRVKRGVGYSSLPGKKNKNVSSVFCFPLKNDAIVETANQSEKNKILMKYMMTNENRKSFASRHEAHTDLINHASKFSDLNKKNRVKDLSLDDQEIIKKYTKNQTPFNNYLKQKIPLNPVEGKSEIENILNKPARNLYQALTKIQPPYVGTTFRFFTTKPSIWGKEIKTGDVVISNTFMSTSSSMSYVKSLSGKVHGDVDKVFIAVRGASGKNIAPYSHFQAQKGEAEVLFLPDAKFKVLKIDIDSNGNKYAILTDKILTDKNGDYVAQVLEDEKKALYIKNIYTGEWVH